MDLINRRCTIYKTFRALFKETNISNIGNIGKKLSYKTNIVVQCVF